MFCNIKSGYTHTADGDDGSVFISVTLPPAIWNKVDKADINGRLKVILTDKNVSLFLDKGEEA